MQAKTPSRHLTAVPLSPQDMEMAAAAQRCIVAALDHSKAASITISTDDGSSPVVAVPPAALKMIGQVLGAMSQGRAITLVPAEQEFTTVQAAAFLNVSRPFVIKEIEAGRLTCHHVGTHRRISFKALSTYRSNMKAQQSDALDRLAELNEEMDLYD